MVSSMSVAKAFAELAAKKKDDKFTLMKLLKLVYIAHGWHLALRERPLIDEQVEAWRYGPVIPSLYYSLKGYGNQPIPYEVTKAQSGIDLSQTDYMPLIEAVWHKYGEFSGIKLSNMTHKPGTPWSQVWTEELPQGTDIKESDIRDYYKSLLQQ